MVPRSIAQLFQESNLSESLYGDVIDWWDEIIDTIRAKKHSKSTKIGRQGEILTLVYEFKRLGIKPRWQSIESNYSGYDILSQVSRSNNSQLPIEVKTSTLPFKQAKFYLTKNEWNVLTENTASRVYLWSIYQEQGFAKLCIIDEKNISNHVPCEKGNGKWTKISIPFRDFFTPSTVNEIKLIEYKNIFANQHVAAKCKS